MVQITFIVLSIILVSNWAVLAIEQNQKTYFDTCQLSCQVVNNNYEAQECRETFCPSYVNYLLTGYVDTDSKPSLVSTNQDNVGEFCSTWIVYLIKQLGWEHRLRINMKECMCAAGKDCIVK